MFERKHCQHVRDQLNRYSTEVNQVSKQINDHMMLHKEEFEIFPDVVTSHYILVSKRDFHQIINISILFYSLNILTSVDLKQKESFVEVMDKFIPKITGEFENSLC